MKFAYAAAAASALALALSFSPASAFEESNARQLHENFSEEKFHRMLGGKENEGMFHIHFVNHDTNKDGFVTPDENLLDLIDSSHTGHIRELLEKVDKNGDGAVDKDEYFVHLHDEHDRHHQEL